MDHQNETTPHNSNRADERPSRPATRREKPTGSNTMELIVFASILGIWLALQLWILPKFGVST
jgi:hypothetical protein